MQIDMFIDCEECFKLSCSLTKSGVYLYLPTLPDLEYTFDVCTVFTVGLLPFVFGPSDYPQV